MRILSYRTAAVLASLTLAVALVACTSGAGAIERRNEAQRALAERAGIAVDGGGAPAAAAPSGGAAPAGDAAKLGQAVANKYGCVACHTPTGSAGIGPTWKGLAGSEVELTNGQKVTADDAYLKESIENPPAKVRRGALAGVMPPDISKGMKPEEIDQVIAYIKTLK